MTDTTTRVAIVTGASGGIGRATAEKLAADGMAVAVHYSGNLQRAQQTVDSIVTAGGRDITVNAVAPGPTATDLFLDGKDEATVENLSKLAPLERLGTPADIAEAVAFLAGPARWVNGQVIYVNGGVI